MQYEKLIPTFGMTARIPTDGGMSVVPKTNKKSPQAPDWR